LLLPPALTLETISVNPQAQLVFNAVPDPNPGGATPYATITLAAAAAAAGAAPPQAAGVIADGIALMKIEYGADTVVVDGVIEPNEWTQVAPANPASVLAVRIALVARSAQPEVTRNAAGQILPSAQCATTTAFPTWVDSANVPLNLSANVGLAATDDWKCYRYKTFENTVTLRN
jgi:hypothetical protein